MMEYMGELVKTKEWEIKVHFLHVRCGAGLQYLLY